MDGDPRSYAGFKAAIDAGIAVERSQTILRQGEVAPIRSGVSDAVRAADARLVQRIKSGNVTYK